MLPVRSASAFGASFVDHLSERGNAPALVTDLGVLSYRELDARVRGVADRLGCERRLIAVLAENTVDAIVAYLAALRGRHPVLLVAADDEAAIRSVCASYDPDVVLAGGTIDERRPAPRHVLHPDLALLLSTSGSTGAPKLVRLSRANLAANAASIASYLALDDGDRAITSLPMQYCYGLSVINSHLEVGASLALTDLSVVDPCFWELFERVSATSLAGVPHTFDLLERAGFESMALPTLRYVTQAGGRMRPELIRRYAGLGAERGWQLFVMYGQTEATARMGYLPPELAATHPHTIGGAIPGGTFAIEQPDDDGIGELVYHGANVMLGYAECTDDLALGRTVDALRTGDLARWTGEGLVEIVGRRSRFIKPFGLRIDLDHLEAQLAAAGVSALCTGDDSRLVVAVDDPAHIAHTEAAIEHRLHLPSSRVHVVQLDELPRLTNGKPDYAAVAAAHRAGAVPAPSRDVVAAFSDILGVEASPDDTFVGLGGDSLSYVEMSIALEDLLGELPRDWHLRPIRDLTAGHPRRRLARVETSVVVRCVATVLIVGNHTGLWHQTGGAHALLGVAGYNFARFQVDGANRWASIARIVVPSMCWMGLLATTADGFNWRHALLVNGLIGTPHSQWAYWFIEALVYIVAALGALFAIPSVARFERRRPFATAAAVVAVGLVFRFDLIDLATSHRIWRPHEVLWLFALGWAAARAHTLGRQLVVVGVAAVSVAGFFNNTSRELIVLLAIALIVWLGAVPLPRSIVGVLGLVASASLYVYLVQFQVYPPVGRIGGPLAATVVSLIAGVAAWVAARRISAIGRSLLGKRGLDRKRQTQGRWPPRQGAGEPLRSAS